MHGMAFPWLRLGPWERGRILSLGPLSALVAVAGLPRKRGQKERSGFFDPDSVVVVSFVARDLVDTVRTVGFAVTDGADFAGGGFGFLKAVEVANSAGRFVGFAVAYCIGGHFRSPLAIACRCVQHAPMSIECQVHTNAIMRKSEAISVRVSEQVKKAAEKAAADDSRSVASLVEKVFAGWLRENGYLPAALDAEAKKRRGK